MLTDNEKSLKDQYPREWAIFRSIDINSDGYVSEDELALMCRQLGIHPTISRDIARTLFEDMLMSENYRSRKKSNLGTTEMEKAKSRTALTDDLFDNGSSTRPVNGEGEASPLHGNPIVLKTPQKNRGVESIDLLDSDQFSPLQRTKSAQLRKEFADSGDPGLRFEDMLEMFSEIYAVRRMARERQWRRCVGLGVAGNVAGHMEMAGEAPAKGAQPVAVVEKKETKAPTPAAIFAFYVPEANGDHSPTKSASMYLPSKKKNLSLSSPSAGAAVQTVAAKMHEYDRSALLSSEEEKELSRNQNNKDEAPPSPPAGTSNDKTAKDIAREQSNSKLPPEKEVIRLREQSADQASCKVPEMIAGNPSIPYAIDLRSNPDGNGDDVLLSPSGEPRGHAKSIATIEKLLDEQQVQVKDNSVLQHIIERLNRFPVTNAVIDYPKEGANIQVEPEVAIYCDILYNTAGEACLRNDERALDEDEDDLEDSLNNGKFGGLLKSMKSESSSINFKLDGEGNPRPPRQVLVEKLIPRKIAAFNDCSIRQLRNSEKLSEKKNWGHGSKGISLNAFPLQNPKKDFSPHGLAGRLVLASYVKRGEEIHAYTKAAPARNYLMFYQPLLKWITEQMNYQQSKDKWEDINELLEACDYPMSCWIALGAGEYTDWGMKHFMQPKDETVVVIYDESVFPKGPDFEEIKSLFNDHGHAILSKNVLPATRKSISRWKELCLHNKATSSTFISVWGA
ncbi:unnamed protein product [Amoebophrya sp. A120]|nr:unnamed protein product [Amoebophrya sp. A120]|eukprot:GSA120T00007156001.1